MPAALLLKVPLTISDVLLSNVIPVLIQFGKLGRKCLEAFKNKQAAYKEQVAMYKKQTANGDKETVSST